MKKYVILFVLFISTTFYAQEGISYQAVIYNPKAELLPGNNATNLPLANKKVCLRFTIIDAASAIEYQETITTTTDDFGMVNLIIGTGNPTGGYATLFDDVVWDSSTKKLQVELDDTANCTTFLEISKQPFTAVPFAYAAKNAENVTGVIAIANGGTGATTLNGARTNLGINNLDNTSDLNKPISNATQSALNTKENTANKSGDVNLGSSNTLFPTQNAVKTYVDNQVNLASIDASTTAKGKIKLAGDLTGTADLPIVKNNAITSAKIANATIVNEDIANATITTAKIDGTIAVANGGTGSNMSNSLGYIKQATTGGNFTTVLPIPANEVFGAIRSVNGVYPNTTTGNVTVPFGEVTTGLFTSRPDISTTSNGDIFVISGETGANASNNGRTFISTGATGTWNEVTSDQASTDARYVQLAGSTMLGNLAFPTNTKVTVVDVPTSSSDLTNKAYVDAQIAIGAPNATTTVIGKIQLAGDLAGPGTTASAPIISDNAITTNKIANNAVATNKLTPGSSNTVLVTDFMGNVAWIDNSSFGAIADMTTIEGSGTTASPFKVKDLGVITAKLSDLAVTTAKIANAAVTTTKIASGGNSKVLVTDNTGVVTWIDTTALGAVADMSTLEGAGTSASPFKVKDLGIITAKLADGAVTTAKIADLNVTTLKIADANVTTAKLADLNVTTNKLANAAVTTTKIASGGINKVLVTDNTGVVAWIDATAFGAVADMSTIEGAGTSASPFKVKDLGIITAKLADGAVTTDKIADLNVSTNKVANNSITTVKIADANVTTAKLADSAVTTTKIASGGNNKVLVTDNTGAVAWLDTTAFGAVADQSTIEGLGTTASPFKVKDLGIITAKLADNAVTTIKIADANVTTVKIADSNITTSKIADANVTNAKLATDAVTTGKILDGTIIVDDLANNAVETAKIKDLNVTTAKLADAAVTTTKIASGGNNKVLVTDNTGAVAWIDGTAFGAVADQSTIEGAGTTASPFKVKDLGIITAKLADNAVTTVKIADANVTTAKIADSNVTTSKIADANVTNAKLATDAVTTGKILDGTIIVDDLANNAVETAKIKDLNVTTAKLADAAVTTTKIASGGNNKVLVTDNTGAVAWIDGTAFGAVADQSTIEGLGTTSSPFKVKDLGIITAKLADNAVTTVKIADANVTTVKIADSNITTSKIADANVTNAKLATDAVTTGKILDGTIIVDDLANNAVETAKIKDLNVTTAKLADAAVTTTKIASGGNNKVLVTDNTGAVAWIDGTAFGAVADQSTIEGAGTTASPFKVKDLGIITAKLADNAVTTIKIADANVTTAKLADASVATAKVIDGNITTNKLANASVTTTKIASGGNNKVLVTDNTGVVAWLDTTAFGAVADMTTIEGLGTTASPFKVKDLAIITAKLADGSVTTVKIADANITTAKIADSNVTTAKIADANITTSKIADSNITTLKVADLNITTGKLADAAVTTTKIASGGNNKVLVTDNTGAVSWIDGTAFGAVADMTTIEGSGTTASPFKVKDLAIITAKLADNAVTTIKIADANVTTAKIADSNVTTAKIADANVTTSKLADSNVTTIKIADSNITTSKLANASVTTAKIASGGNNKVLVTDNTGVVAWIDGTAFGAVADMTTIEGSGTTASPFKVKDLGIITAKLADGAVTTIKLADANVTTVKIADSNVTTAKIADANVTNAKLASDAVTTGKILNGTILNEDIADSTITTSKIAGQIAVTDGGTGADMSTTVGYVRQATTGANFTTVTSIPVADIAGAVRKVNGNLPDSNGNVAIEFGTVATGILANIPVVTSPGLVNGDIYVVSGDSNPLNNGLTYIFDGTQWQEVTPNQAALDARYLRLAGGMMQGNIVIPTTKKITITDTPNTATDAANKAYVDAQITSATPDATTGIVGKIQLGGDLAGIGTTALAPIISDNAITNNKIQADAISSDKISNGTIQAIDLANGIITNAKLAEAITVANGGTGATTLTGYVKGNGTNAMTASATIPVADVVGAQTTANLSSNMIANTGSTTMYPSVAAVESFVTTNATVDATTLIKGKIKLAGDLAGTADLPTVPGLITKAPLASPALTGTPTAPTAIAGTNTSQIATTEFVTAAVSNAATPDASLTIKGKIKLAGDLAGSNDASNPTIATGAISTTKLADNAITTIKITDENITTAKIANDAIINAKLADNAVQTENIVDANITTSKLAPISVTPSKMEPGSNNTVLITDNTGAVVWINKNSFGAVADMSTIEGLGTTTSPFKIKDGGISTIKLADNAVTTLKIYDDAVTTNKIANNSVVTSKIADAAVTNSKIGESITVTNGGTGATTLTGYVKGTGTTAMTASLTIPVADITGAQTTANLTTNMAIDAGSTIKYPSVSAVETYVATKAPLASPALTGIPTAPTAALGTNTTQVATTEFVTTAVATATPDASTTVKGKIKLAGDLGGTADLPTVPGLATKEPTITAGTASQYWRGDKTWQALDKSAVGLGNVDNTSDANKPISTATQTALNLKAPLASPALTGTPTAPTAISGTNTTQVATTEFVTTAVAAATIVDATTLVKGKIQLAGDLGGTADLPTVPGLATKEPTITAGIASQYWRGDKTWQALDKSAVGLGNVDNTSDANKPISTATQTALNLKAPLASPALTGTPTAPTATSGTNTTQVATTEFVTTAVAAATIADATTLVKGKIQLAGDLGGTAASPTVPGLATKEPTIAAGTTSQYWRGDKTWQTLDKSAVGLGNVDNTSDTNKPISTATQTALNLKAPLASPALTGTPTAPTAASGTNTTQVATTEFVTTAVTTAISAATPDASTTVKGKIKLAGDLGGTADNPVIVSAAITTSKIAPGANNTVLVTDNTGAVAWINKTTLGSVADMTTIEGDGTTTSPFKVKDLGIVTAKLADNSVTSAKITDGTIVTSDIANSSITNAKLAEVISVTNGGTGANMSSTSGYVKQATTGANFTTVATIPVAHITGAVQKVNGSTPDANGNVSVTFGTVFTGTLANRSTVVSNPNNGDIYVVSGDVTATNNGITYIYDGNSWQEVTANQASLDARYLKLAGGTMAGDVTIPTGKRIVITDQAVNATDAANKAYVDAQIAAATPDATTTVKGKIKLAGDLGGTADLPTVPGLATKEPTIAAGTTSQYWRGDKTWQALDKSAVGLGNVDNTSDANKPISTATQTALNLKAPLASPALTGTPTAPTAASGTNTTQVATTEFVTTAVAAATIADATTLVKGKIQLAGDLGGTAASPTVAKIQTTPVSATAPTLNQLLQYNGTAWTPVAKSSVASFETEEFVPTLGQTSFSITNTPLGKVALFINGVRVPKTAITISGTTITYIPANNGTYTLLTTDRVTIDYIY
jgi:uncharacterized protein YjbI with pentapeptide repeats